PAVSVCLDCSDLVLAGFEGADGQEKRTLDSRASLQRSVKQTGAHIKRDCLEEPEIRTEKCNEIALRPVADENDAGPLPADFLVCEAVVLNGGGIIEEAVRQGTDIVAQDDVPFG